jgi:peptidoglycan/xylan/chitin deacetylase (PgdA/CDA1 family)
LPTGPGAPFLSHVPTDHKVVFITIDDGWSRVPEFVNYVRDNRLPITVFLLNDAAKNDYGYFRELQQAGAVIEDHTLTHANLTKLSPAQQKQQICGAADIFAKEFGRRPVLFRPPYGAKNASVFESAAACGMKAVVNWTVAVNDGQVQYQVGNHLRPGDIVLMHFRPTIMTDIQALMKAIQEQGFAVGKLEAYVGG